MPKACRELKRLYMVAYAIPYNDANDVGMRVVARSEATVVAPATDAGGPNPAPRKGR